MKPLSKRDKRLLLLARNLVRVVREDKVRRKENRHKRNVANARTKLEECINHSEEWAKWIHELYTVNGVLKVETPKGLYEALFERGLVWEYRYDDRCLTRHPDATEAYQQRQSELSQVVAE